MQMPEMDGLTLASRIREDSRLESTQLMLLTSAVLDLTTEQLEATAKEAAKSLFMLRFQSQSERLNTPTEIKKNRRLIARIKTIQTERTKATAAK